MIMITKTQTSQNVTHMTGRCKSRRIQKVEKRRRLKEGRRIKEGKKVHFPAELEQPKRGHLNRRTERKFEFSFTR